MRELKDACEREEMHGRKKGMLKKRTDLHERAIEREQTCGIRDGKEAPMDVEPPRSASKRMQKSRSKTKRKLADDVKDGYDEYLLKDKN